MQFHGYLDTLLGSKVAIKLLRLLVSQKGKVFTVRGLAKEAGVWPSEAAIAVQQLEKYGILRIQPVGRSYLLSLNDKSYVLDKIVKPAIKAEAGTLDELVSILQRNLNHEEVISAVLFGSVAERNEREDSDIDILIVSDDFEAAAALAAKAAEQVSLTFNKRLSPLIMNKKELLARKDRHLMRSILGSCIHVAGKDMRKVVAR